MKIKKRAVDLLPGDLDISEEGNHYYLIVSVQKLYKYQINVWIDDCIRVDFIRSNTTKLNTWNFNVNDYFTILK